MSLADDYRTRGLRQNMVEKIAAKGITNKRILDAINTIPRHFFLKDTAFIQRAYEDIPFQIGAGQTISQPFTVAFQTQLLDPQPMEKILEIGTGSAYQAAVLSLMGARVFTIERIRSLHENAKKMMEELKYHNIRFFYGDGFEGKVAYAPYDKILITAAAPEIPTGLISQLKIGGVMVLPFGEGESQTMLRITKLSETEIQQEDFRKFKFVPMLKGKIA